MKQNHQHSASDRTPYTYVVLFPSLNQLYYGVRYARNCHPSELGVDYKSSSKLVKHLLSDHPNAKFTVRRIFNDIEKAKLWETKVLKRIDAANHSSFLNKHNNNLFPVDNSGKRNPMFGLPGTMLGRKHSAETRKKIGEKNKGEKNYWHTSNGHQPFLKGKKHKPESIELMKKKASGENNGFFGKNHSDKTRKQIAKSNTGKIHTEETKKQIGLSQTGEKNKNHKGWFHTPNGSFPTSRQAESAGYNQSWIIKVCKNCDNIITKANLKTKHLTPFHLGKTFRQVGFWFEPVISP